MKVLMVVSSLIGVALAVLLFFFLPTWIFGLLGMAFPALANRSANIVLAFGNILRARRYRFPVLAGVALETFS